LGRARRGEGAEQGLVDHAPGLVGQQQVERDQVGGRQQLRQFHEPLSGRGQPGRVAVQRPRDDVHADRLEEARQARADAAVADDPGRLPGQLDALPDVPLPRPDGAVVADDVLGQREGEGEGVLGDGGIAVVGDVRDRDAAISCDRQVDESGRAGAGERDELERGQSAQHRAGEIRAEDDDRGVADPGDQLVVVLWQVGVEAGTAEAVEAGGEVGPRQQGGHVRIAVGQHDRGRHWCIIPRSRGGARGSPVGLPARGSRRARNYAG
jgi:hypothetical protein